MLMSIVNKECRPTQSHDTQDKEPKHLPENISESKKALIEPEENDVLYGRGERINSHLGNKTFRVLVSDRKHRYNIGKNEEKTQVAREILQIITMNGGRFLNRESNRWVEVGLEKALRKTSQALREKQTNGFLFPHNNMSYAPRIFHPIHPNVAPPPRIHYGRPKSPDIFADADCNDDSSSWVEFYRSNKRKCVFPPHIPPQHIPPQHIPPQHIPPQHIPPQHMLQQHIPPQHIPPQHIPPQHVPPQRVPPQRVPPQHVPPQRVPTQRASPEHIPSHVPSQHITPRVPHRDVQFNVRPQPVQNVVLKQAQNLSILANGKVSHENNNPIPNKGSMEKQSKRLKLPIIELKDSQHTRNCSISGSNISLNSTLKKKQPLIDMIPPDLLRNCFSFLPISSHTSVLDVSKRFQKVYKIFPSLKVPLKNYLQIQLRKLESEEKK